jgi:hypothetical protein
MYLSFSPENMITVGVMLLVWMVALHLLGQMGVYLPQWTGIAQKSGG